MPDQDTTTDTGMDLLKVEQMRGHALFHTSGRSQRASYGRVTLARRLGFVTQDGQGRCRHVRREVSDGERAEEPLLRAKIQEKCSGQ